MENLKKQINIWLIVFAYQLCAFTSFGQAAFAKEDPAEFIAQVQALLNNTGLPRCQEVASNFSTVWSSLGTAEQEKIMQIAHKMSKINATAKGEYTSFYASIANGILQSSLDGEQLGNLLSAAEATLDKFDPKTAANFFFRMDSFFYLKSIYSSSFFRLYAEEGSYTITFYDESVDENPENSLVSDSLLKLEFGFRPLGAAIKFNGANLTMASTFDSLTIVNTSGVYFINKDMFWGTNGRFDWTNIFLSKVVPQDDGSEMIEMLPEYGDLAEGDAYCEFKDYVVEAGKAHLKATTATLNYKPLLNGTTEGSFEYTAHKRKIDYQYEYFQDEDNKRRKRVIGSLTTANYPKFLANNQKVVLDNLGENVRYEGGFFLEGRMGYGVADKGYAQFVGTRYTGDPNFLVRSKKFIFTDSTVVTSGSKFSIYLGKTESGLPDSIYHPSLEMTYRKNDSKIVMVRNRKSVFGHTSFSNTHHKMYIDADGISYDLKTDSLDIFMISLAQYTTDSNQVRVPVRFESFNFYDRERYDEISGLYDFQPVKLFELYARKIDTTAFNLKDMSAYVRRDLNTLRSVALQLSTIGFVEFDDETNFVTILPRLVHNSKAEDFMATANAVNRDNRSFNKKGRDIYPSELKFETNGDRKTYYNYDFDDMYIRAYPLMDTTEKNKLNPKLTPNASMKLDVGELQIRGIDIMPVSKNLDVFMKPGGEKKEIILYPDRYIYLPKGEVLVRQLRLVGEEFFLKYSDFTLEMNLIDKIYFKVQDSTGNYRKDSTNKDIEYGDDIHYQNAETGSHVAGTMFLNDPENKSGLKHGKIIHADGEEPTNPDTGANLNYGIYPKLNVPDGGYADFKRATFNVNVADVPSPTPIEYDTTLFRFEMPVISLDSMYYKDPEFPGTLKNNIFPPITEMLIGMPDGAMGFIHTPPETGYPLYPDIQKVESITNNTLNDGDRKIYELNGNIRDANIDFRGNKLIMNKKGLRSKGTIHYLTADITSDYSFIFTPQYVISDTVQFKIKEGVAGDAGNFPEAEGTEGQLLWYAQQDSLLFNNSARINTLLSVGGDTYNYSYPRTLFTLYKSLMPVTMNGTLILQKAGLFGYGTIIRKDFEMLSLDLDQKFEFDPSQIIGKATEFKIYSAERDPYDPDQQFNVQNPAILQGNFVDVLFDLNEGNAAANPNKAIAELNYTVFTFPYALFKTSIQTAIYDSKTREITMTGDTTSIFASTYFNEGYDKRNVVFNGNFAHYDIDKLEMEVAGVPDIHSADAKIIPDMGKVVLLKGSNIDTLKNARLVIDTLPRPNGGFHNLFDGQIKIESRLHFSGNATYQFRNANKDTFNIKFEEFQLEDAAQVEAVTKVSYEETEKERKAREKKEKEEAEKALKNEDELSLAEKEKLKEKELKKAAKEKKDNPEVNNTAKTEQERENQDEAIRKGIGENAQFITVARGHVKEEDKLYLTKGILFKGDVIMYANVRSLAVNGFIKMDLKSVGNFDNWIPYSNSKSLDEGELSVSNKFEVKGEDGQTHIITSGIHFRKNERTFYSTFISPVELLGDEDFFLAGGGIGYNDATKEYAIRPSRRSGILSGNELTFNDNDATMTIKGKMEFMDAIHRPYLHASGYGEVDTRNSIYYFNPMLSFRLPIPAKSMPLMSAYVASQKEPVPLELKDDGSDEIAYRIASTFGDKTIQDYSKKKSLVESSKEFAQSITFSELDMAWSEDNLAFYSEGKLKLLNVFDRIINADVDGLIEIRKRPEEAGFTLYFEVGKDWYFFDMQKNVLSVASSDGTLMDELAKKQSKKEETTDGKFALKTVGIPEKETFTAKFEAYYSGLPPVKKKRIEEATDIDKKPKTDDKKPKTDEEEDK